MYTKLKGIIEDIEEGSTTLMVNGVGYLIFVPQNVALRIKNGEEKTLYIQTIVKEDSISLYGFLDIDTKNLFNLLITVQGVGPRIGMAILSTLSPRDIAKAIAFEDSATLKQIPGIGLKVAQRLTNELKDKITKLNISSNLSLDKSQAKFIKAPSSNIKEATAVLQGMGFGSLEINNAINAMEDVDKKTTPEDIIKFALKYFGKKQNL